MIRFLTCISLAASQRDARRAIVIGCAIFGFLWHLLPRTPAGREVMINVPDHSAPRSSGSGADFDAPKGGAMQAARRFLVPLTSPRLEKLEAMAAELHRPEHRRLPPEYYAAQWRLTAARYYYERDVQRERNRAKHSNQPASADAAPPLKAVGAGSVLPVSFDSAARSPSSTDSYGSGYWDHERRRAEAEIRRFLAQLPSAGASSQRADVVIGAVVAGRPTTLSFLGAVAASAFGACSVLRLQRSAISSDGVATCQPSLRLELPGHWFQQAPPRRERWVRRCAAAAWLTVVLSIGLEWLR